MLNCSSAFATWSPRFPEVERAALDFIRAQSPAVTGEFTFYSLDFLWEDKPHMFAMEFTLAGDDDGIWRVELSTNSQSLSDEMIDQLPNHALQQAASGVVRGGKKAKEPGKSARLQR